MGLVIALLILFFIIGICEQVYFYRKILGAVRYFAGGLSRRNTHLVTVGIFLLTLLPAAFAFLKWFIIEMHIAAFLLLSDLTVVIVREIRKRKVFTYPGWLKPVYRTGAAAFLLTFAVVCYGKYNMHHIVRTEYDVNVNKPLAREYTIALIADVHAGLSLDPERLREIVVTIEEDSPDFVILCGDVVDELSTTQQMSDAFAVLGTFHTRLGTYYVYGNHDKSRTGTDGRFTNMQLAETIRQNRIEILEDHAVLFNDDLVFVGRVDKMERSAGGGKSIEQILTGVDKSKVILVADHQPNDYEALRKAGCDLVVSGHTHGGQIFPFGLFSELIRANDMTYGYQKFGNLHAIVTSGLAGWGFDMRTEHHSEYVIIHLRGNN